MILDFRRSSSCMFACTRFFYFLKCKKFFGFCHHYLLEKNFFNFIKHAVDQGCPTCGPLKVLVWPSDDFQFSGYNEGYEEEFHEIAKRHLGRKLINKRRF